jgi:hypothetical protein
MNLQTPQAGVQYKPSVLNQIRFNPSDETLSIIDYCAKRGIKGKVGDLLPVGISAESHDWINKHHLAFENLVSAKTGGYQRQLARLKRYRDGRTDAAPVPQYERD